MTLVLETEKVENHSLPATWVEVPIGAWFEVVTGNTPSKAQSEYYDLPYIPFVKPPELLSCLVNKAEEYLSEAGAKVARVVPEGTVFVSCIGNLAKTGLATRDVAFNQQINAIKPDFRLAEPKFIFYQIQMASFKNRMEEASSATTVTIINKGKFEKLTINLAPLNEQKRVVSKIDELFSQLDDGEAALRRAQKQVEQYQQSVLKAAVTGELTKDWRENNKGNIESGDALLQRILKARREAWEQAELAKMQAKGKSPKDEKWKEKYPEPKSPDTSNLPELPEGWVWASLSQVSTMIADVDHKMPKGIDEGIPYISTKDFYGENEIDFENAKQISQSDFDHLCRKIHPTFGDILLSRYGTIGKVRRITRQEHFQASYSIAIIKTLQFDVLNDFIVLCLNSAIMQSQMKRDTRATAQPDLGLEHIRQHVLPIPSISEQVEIIQQAQEKLTSLIHLEFEISNNFRLINALKQSTLKAAFSGQLVPQDPNDEPASELLKRIAEERETLGEKTPKPKARRTKD